MAIYLEPVTTDDDHRFSRPHADTVDELRGFREQAGITSEFVRIAPWTR